VTRRGWAAAILAAWGVSLGWLVKRELFRTTSERLAEAALSVPPGSEYYRLDLGSRQIGFASTSLDTLGPTLRVTDLVTLDLPVLGTVHHTRARSQAIVSRTLHLETLDVAFDGDDGRFDAHGEVRGDSVLALTFRSGDEAGTARVRLPMPVVLPSLVPLRLAFGGGLKPGRVFVLRVFDPVELAERDVRVTIAGESTLVVPDSAVFDSTAMAWIAAHFDTVRAVKIEQRSAGLTTSEWIDAAGRLVRRAGPAGLALERSAWEIAYENFHRPAARRAAPAPTRRAPAPGSGPGAVIPSTALAAGVMARRATRPPEVFRARLLGVDLAGLALGGDGQELAGDTLVVHRAVAADLAARYTLPATDPALARWLGAAPLIQSANPGVRAQARAIVAGERDPARAAAALTRWVAAALQRERGAGVPGAAQVLARRRGDCNAFTLLYVALARAAGLPARPAAGLLELGGRFYYHAWPEVYLARWVPVDPMLDQFPADAAHLRFTRDGLAHQLALLPFIGRLRLEVL
jgi:transglutaminase-like putative cysteine protease